MDPLTLTAAFLVALFWALVSVFAPLLPKAWHRQPPQPASRPRRRQQPSSSSKAGDAIELLPALGETSSESSSLFSTAAASLNSDYDTSVEPLTPAPSEELPSAPASSSGRSYRKFSDFKSTFTTPFGKRRSVTVDGAAAATTVKPSRDRSRSSSRTRSSFSSIFSQRQRTSSAASSLELPITPDSQASLPLPVGKPKRSSEVDVRQRAPAKPRGSLQLNMPPLALTRMQQRRVSAPAAGPSAASATANTTTTITATARVEWVFPLAKPTASPTESPVNADIPLPSCDQPAERGRSKRMSWTRPFSKRPSDTPTSSKASKPSKEQRRSRSIHPPSPVGPRPSTAESTGSRPSVDSDAIIDKRYESSSEAPLQKLTRTRTWFERREERARRARSADRARPDRHAISAQIAQQAWGAPRSPS
ncbi:hypothetical protein AURDEDRAFT_179614 [Auricularia subglabra TFB-10046 SS5]|nr:hypothetical protein AURDEDRAFT_179614 [Auricularia subglabra TFB-10046 SS5]